jgi:hypothetical protein
LGPLQLSILVIQFTNTPSYFGALDPPIKNAIHSKEPVTNLKDKRRMEKSLK